jgi:hypothetical protein
MLIQDNEEQVKLLVTFDSHIDLDRIIAELQERYLFIQLIKKCSKNELLISFDSMLDLLEI